MKKTKLDYSFHQSMERIYPENIRQENDVEQTILKIHLERYCFAAKNIQGTNILDMACGSGYGSAILAASRKNLKVIGVDVDGNAITYAKKKYHQNNLQFIQADGVKFIPLIRFDSIVSLETIEHLPEPEIFLDNLIKILSPKGLIIASVPITPSVDINSYHVNDFNEESFHGMFRKRGFRAKKSLFQEQSISPFDIINKKSSRFSSMRKNIWSYYLLNPQAFSKRLLSILKYGFTNRYLTVVWER